LKLFTLGKVSLVVTAVKIVVMALGSFAVGRILGWSFVDSLFLGIALTPSSTAIIAKCVADMGKLGEESCDIMFGVLMLEDLIVVMILAMLQSFYGLGVVSITGISYLIAKLVLFLAGSVLIGRKILLPFIGGVSRESKEILVVMTVGLCFGYSVAAHLLGFSVAAGALIAGMVLASWVGASGLFEETLALRDVFSAIFFVSVGALMEVPNLRVFVLPDL
jgi:CPA2 family monovalent cation:H+ antiporter-2